MRRLPGLGLALLLVGMVAASCTRPELSLPRTPPSIAGTITAADPGGEHLGSIRVEAVPGEEAGSDKAVVRIGQRTALMDDSGQRIGLNQLKVGRKVRVWFTGPVRESYPVQADAATILLEPAGR
jgi:uncharacterized protein DUF3221